MEVTKYLFPALFCALWLLYVKKTRSRRFAWVGLFFVSFAAFSQNFEFIFRDFHQAVQVPMILLGFIAIIQGKAPRTPVKIFLVILGFIVLSIVCSTLDTDARSQLVNYVAVVGVASFLLTQFKGFDLKQQRIFARFMVWLGFLVALSGLFEVAITGVARAEGTFANPNYFALFIGICYSFLFVKRLSWHDLALAGVMLLVILLSGSRSALIVPLLSHLWSIWRSEKLRTRAQKVALISLAIVLSSVSLSGLLDRAGADASDAERILFTRIGWRMSLDQPVTGVGWGRFPVVFSDYASNIEGILLSDQSVVDVSGQEQRVSHNDFVRVMAELGFPAGAFFTLVFVTAMITAFRATGMMSNVMMPVLLGLLLFSITHNNLNTATTWFFLTMPFAMLRVKNSKE